MQLANISSKLFTKASSPAAAASLLLRMKIRLKLTPFQARRAENSEVDENEALCDATMLYEVGMKQLEEHTAMLVRILVLKSCEHVSAVRFHYRQVS